MNYYVFNLLADFFTGLSLVCGFIAVIFSLESHFTFSSWAIILSVVFDGIDGQIARLSPTTNEFGKELDSLVDAISFGIAPAVLGYTFVYRRFYLWATLALFLYLVCSVVRLAKYNITPKDKSINYFSGLPTTISGGIVASFILIYRRDARLPPPFIFLLLVLLLAFLMVSKTRYLNLDGIIELFRTNKVFALGIILILLMAFLGFFLVTSIFLSELIIFALLLIYLIFSPFMVKSFEISK